MSSVLRFRIIILQSAALLCTSQLFSQISENIINNRSGQCSLHEYGAANSLPNYQEALLTGGVQEAWVRHYASWMTSVNFRVNAIVRDEAGNVYTTGSSEGAYSAIKYNSAGLEQWMARHNGPGIVELGISLCVDAAGNVYVTGSGGGDVTTIKYNAAGNEQWASRYTSPGNYDDVPTAVVVDAIGNVFVTGCSKASQWTIDEKDIVTIKYNAKGVEEWVKYYNGPANLQDTAIALAVDAESNAYVTGVSTGSGTGDDYATIKYNSAGEEQWVVRYNNQENKHDYPKALFVDGAGNVYVTGWSNNAGNNRDYVTIKYNSNGAEKWVVCYHAAADHWGEPSALAVDSAGNVFVAGKSSYSGSVNELAVIKYNSAGIEQWAMRSNNQGKSYNDAISLSLDNLGNVYMNGVSGNSYDLGDFVIIKYDGAGAEQWTAHLDGPWSPYGRPSNLFIDSAGSVYITGIKVGSNGLKYLNAKKYNGAGEEQREIYFGSKKTFALARDVHTDATGNIYVTGQSMGLYGFTDYATIKYNGAGEELWAALYNSPNRHNDRASTLCVDATGNVYVTGWSYILTEDRYYATIKYNSAGVEQWVARYHTWGYSEEKAIALFVDSAGNVYVAGTGGSEGTGFDYATIKYDSAGVEQWVARYTGPGNQNDEVTAIAVDAAGNVYVTGISPGSTGFGTRDDYVTIKYNSAGLEQWARRYDGPAHDGDDPCALCVDDASNVYVTGSSMDSNSFDDYATIKYNKDGVVQWIVRYKGRGESPDWAKALFVDLEHNVYVTGYSEDDFVTVKYNQAGAEQWVVRYNGPGNSQDSPSELAVDADDNIYVSGYSEGSGNLRDYATIKYNSDGTEQWVARHTFNYSLTNFYNEKCALALDAKGNVYVAGSDRDENNYYFTTIKYTQAPTSVIQEHRETPDRYGLRQNHPNPFNPITTITYELADAAAVELVVYNALGQKIRTLALGRQNSGSHQIIWNGQDDNSTAVSSGLYLYKLTAGDFVQMRKMVLMR